MMMMVVVVMEEVEERVCCWVRRWSLRCVGVGNCQRKTQKIFTKHEEGRVREERWWWWWW